MRKKLIYVSGFVMAAVAVLASIALFNMRDRHPGYQVDIDIKASSPGVVRAGFAAVSITPEVIDTWIDVRGNARFNPREGDYFIDNTGSGSFDAVWLAGFSNRRPAMGVRDDLWARAMVLDDGRTRLAWVSLDSIGFFHCDVIDVRKRLPAELGVDYCIISSTHTHSAPDLMGQWGPSLFSSGVDPGYMEQVKSGAVEAVRLAAENLRPARFRFAVDREGAVDMIADTRPPVVVDGALRMMQAVDAEDGTTLGTLVSWDNHVETLWNRNLLVSSDFPHYAREGIEEGVYDGDNLVSPGLGGVAVYVAGNTGGLMTTHPRVGIECPFTGEVCRSPSVEKARTQGLEIALMVLEALNAPDVREMEYGSIVLRARTVELPLDNFLFRLAGASGLIRRGMTGWMKVRSEISFWELGPASFLHHPGELYPEIADGGVEAPEGRDFEIPPQEVPPLREVMPGELKFITGMSNDMVGYVIPKSQWDAKPPYTYGAEKSHYGEQNSLGPETAPILHRAMLKLMEVAKKRGE